MRVPAIRAASPVLGLALVLTVFASSASAQTLLANDGWSAGPTPLVWELGGPPDPALCAYPAGPIVASWPTTGGVPCPLPGMATPPLGDIAVDRLADRAYPATGGVIGEFSGNGITPMSGFLTGLPINGLDLDASAGTLWVTDGGLVAEQSIATCGATASLVSGPWGVPVSFGILTGISVDPASGTLWVCDDLGQIGNFSKTGTLLSGPTFAATGGLSTSLRGIAVDTATPNALGAPLALFLTDGTTVAYVDATTGGPAAPTFYAPSPSWMPPTNPLQGLAYTAHGIVYGSTPDAASIHSAKQSVVGGTIDVVLSGATPGADAYLLLNSNVLMTTTGYLCPAASLGFPGKPLHVDPAPFGPIPLGSVPASGVIVLPLALGTTPPGVGIYCQFLMDLSPGVPGGPYEVTEGLRFTVARP